MKIQVRAYLIGEDNETTEDIGFIDIDWSDCEFVLIEI